MIKFGTDGWRAILNQEFNDENVKRVTLAIGKYVYDNFGFQKKILIGYDPREKADFYAEMTSNILAAKGFDIELSEKIVPTPVLAYNAKLKNACAVMFTASHNPPEYLGMKFIPDYAGPATSDITDKIVENIDKDFTAYDKNGEVKKVDFYPNYYSHICKLIDFEKIKALKSKIIFDGLYSASIGYFDKILDEQGIKYKALNMKHDTNFGGMMPDPKPQYLGNLISEVKNTNNSIGLANDGDADRFGVIDEDGNYVSPNVIIAILLKYLVKKGYQGSVVKTVGSSLLIDVISKKLNIPVIETAVGFKHVGEAMRKNTVIIGGEESGGLSILGHIPEKDGILANLLILEAVADSGLSLSELHKELFKFAGCNFYTNRHDFKKSDSSEINKILEYFKNIDKIGDFEITDINLKDGVKLMLGDKTKILVRPSGTEPLLRVYFESDDKTQLSNLENITDKIIDKIA